MSLLHFLYATASITSILTFIDLVVYEWFIERRRRRRDRPLRGEEFTRRMLK